MGLLHKVFDVQNCLVVVIKELLIFPVYKQVFLEMTKHRHGFQVSYDLFHTTFYIIYGERHLQTSRYICSQNCMIIEASIIF